MIDVYCFCGYCYSFRGDIGICPHCDEEVTMTRVSAEGEGPMRADLSLPLTEQPDTDSASPSPFGAVGEWPGGREPDVVASRSESTRKGPQMSEHRKALLCRVVDEAWNQGKLEVVDELFAPDYQEHNPGPEQEPGIAGYKGNILRARAAFPDLFLDVHEILAEDDRIAILFTLHGTHDGELMGIPASEHRVSNYGTAFARFQDGKVVERAGVQDMLTLLQQIGALPVGATGEAAELPRANCPL